MDKSLVVSIVLLTTGIFLAPFISNLLRIPVAVGEVIYGIILGNSFLQLIHQSQWLDFLSNFGFLVLMFMAGLEVKLSEIRELSGREKFVVFTIPILIFTVAFAFGGFFHLKPIVSIAIGAVSVGIIVSVLREIGQLSSPYGKLVFLTGTAGEFLSIFVLTIYSILVKFGFGVTFFIKIGQLIAFFIVARVILIILKSLMWWYPEEIKIYFEKNPTEIGARISIAIMFALSALATLIDVEPILGAFIAGMIFSTVFPNTEKIEEKLSGISFGFLIPVFFIYVGIKFKMPGLDTHLLMLLGLLILGSYLAKILPSLLMILTGISFKRAVSAGFLLSAPLTLVIVTAEMGKALNLIDHHTEAALILLAIITGIISPVFFNILNKGSKVENNHS
ncbi:cation:proton antiporter [Desulfurobacterium atlanticum]|uniref:Transporter, CPA2 family n=1 Tax=Desulfurobacterium atlanticum TaxID=240169 RepID=A0A238YDD5_9BACT|nr:cation:proton antiporter [Desulfurobacterium atlanticum]SNR69070.1 transporter, CPA2 family [Desulfurobacterium atlanticum]